MKRIALLLGLLLLLPALAHAGGGPETTLVVVNADSPLSRVVANEYVALRDIPESHVVELTGIPTFGVVDIDFFATQILAPIEAALKERGIEDEVDLIEYSADFPYAVNFRSRLKDAGIPTEGPQRFIVGGVASLTGVTYLARHVKAGDPFWDLGINRYFRLVPAGGGGNRRVTPEEQRYAAAAEQALRAKDYAAAAEAYGKLVATFREHPAVWYNYACCLARLGRTGPALDALALAVKCGYADAGHARGDADLESLRKEKRFAEILDSIGGKSLPLRPTHGFRSAYAWGEDGAPAPATGSEKDRYRLATVLAVTGHEGNTLPEILGYLEAAARSDGTRPDGTVYLCRNGDVRSTTREPFFPTLIARMRELGRKVEILDKDVPGQDGVLPKGKKDVIGAVVGRAGFDWGKCGSAFLPGAIAEHLTSFGAYFDTASQTKLTEFLRYGAAGASGTVIEPLALPMKFPNPLIHAFYAEGCDLAEAFYQSLQGPFQLLIVGDGLARPFADLVDVKVDAPPAPWTGTVTLAPKAKGAATFELFVDGRRLATGTELGLDTTKLADGWHDVRVVAVGPAPIETRSYRSLGVTVANGGEKADAEFRGKLEVPFEDGIEIRGRGTAKIEILHHGRIVAERDGAVAKVRAGDVGPGPVVLVPRLTYADGSTWISTPVRVRVEFPKTLAAGAAAKAATEPGLVATVTGGKATRGYVLTNVGDGRGGATMANAIAEKAADSIVLEGEIEAPADGFYRLLVETKGKLTVAIDGETIAKGVAADGAAWLPVSLAKGWHPIRIELAPAGRPDLEILMGGDTVTDVPKVRHAAAPLLDEKPEKTESTEEGLVVEWKKTIRRIGGVRLYPQQEKGFPADLVVEHRSGYGGWREVKDPVVVVAPGKEGLRYVEIRFGEDVRAKEIRVRPAGGGGLPAVAKVEVIEAER